MYFIITNIYNIYIQVSNPLIILFIYFLNSKHLFYFLDFIYFLYCRFIYIEFCWMLIKKFEQWVQWMEFKVTYNTTSNIGINVICWGLLCSSLNWDKVDNHGWCLLETFENQLFNSNGWHFDYTISCKSYYIVG